MTFFQREKGYIAQPMPTPIKRKRKSDQTMYFTRSIGFRPGNIGAIPFERPRQHVKRSRPQIRQIAKRIKRVVAARIEHVAAHPRTKDYEHADGQKAGHRAAPHFHESMAQPGHEPPCHSDSECNSFAPRILLWDCRCRCLACHHSPLPACAMPVTPEFRFESPRSRELPLRRCTHSLRCARRIPAGRFRALSNCKYAGSSAARRVSPTHPCSRRCREPFLQCCDQYGEKSISRNPLSRSHCGPLYPPAIPAVASLLPRACESIRKPCRAPREQRRKPLHISPAPSRRSTPSR